VDTQKNQTYLGGTAGVTINGPNGHAAVLDGGVGNDVVVAGTGATVLIGAGDTLTGTNAANTFVFAPEFGQNTITNFNLHNDTLELPKSEFADFAAVLADAHQNGTDTVIAHDAHDVITLHNVSLSELHDSHVVGVRNTCRRGRRDSRHFVGGIEPNRWRPLLTSWRPLIPTAESEGGNLSVS
jgi:Ca2+-binding RTX toxin-like protein